MPTPLQQPHLDPAEGVGALGGSIGVSAVTEVTRRLLSYFSSDAIQPGDRLPPERQLALTLGVGRSAVREALAALELLGMVNIRPGSGTYLRGRASELLPQALSWGLLIGNLQTEELSGVRHGLEVQAARLAAQFVTPEILEEMEQLVMAMEASTDDYQAFIGADLRFHQAVAAGAKNRVLADLLQTVRSLIRVWAERSVDDPAQTRRTAQENRAIYQAVSAGDADGAAAAMNAHMVSADTRLTDSLPHA